MKPSTIQPVHPINPRPVTVPDGGSVAGYLLVVALILAIAGFDRVLRPR